MQKFFVTGMSCAACVSRVESAVKKVPGVSSCEVSLLTNSMTVDGSASAEKIIRAVKKSGYGAQSTDEKNSAENSMQEKMLSFDDEISALKKRLLLSVIFLATLMYLTMGVSMCDFPVPQALQKNPGAQGIIQLLLSLFVIFFNRKFFSAGIKSLFSLHPNMDSLVALGSGASFAYSLAVLFLMTDFLSAGELQKAMHCLHNLYFESAATIPCFITVGKLLEAVSKGKTTGALKGLLKLAPETATVIRGEKEIQIPAAEIQPDEIFIVKPGEKIPADGIVLEGESAVDESALTGESIPRDKNSGDEISSATINLNGFLKCRATRTGSDTTLSKIVQLVTESSATKAPVAKTADKVSAVFVPSVMAISAVTFFAWIFFGAEFSFALSRAVSVLVISCPCALGLATPVAIMVANGVAAKNGILFKTSAAMEETGRAKIVAMDKTGTITKGECRVQEFFLREESDENKFWKTAAALENLSEHPLSKAVVKFAEEKKFIAKENFPPVENFKVAAGKGIEGIVGGEICACGNLKFISQKISLSDEDKKIVAEISGRGETPLLFCAGKKLSAIISAADSLKDDSAQAVKIFESMKMRTIMLTGDNERTAKSVAEKCGIGEVVADVLPDGKAEKIREIKSHGKTIMIGDGINDAPSLTVADVGMAIGSGTDIAMDAADVVLMKDSLLDAAAAVQLSRRTLFNIRQNLFWAFFYNSAGIPLAAGAFYKIFGWTMNPMAAAAAMSLSSFCVVTNSLRLNFFSPKKIAQKKIFIKRRPVMATEKIIRVEGMKCPHCESHVKEALEKIPGVEEAAANHEKNEVTLKLSKDVDEKKIKKAVEKAGYVFAG